MADALREEPKRLRRRKPLDVIGLTREVIVDAALAYIDEEGLDTFSIRNLALRLGVYPTALYWYVPNKNELLALVVARVLEDAVSTTKRRTLQTYLRGLFNAYRSVMRAHPNVAPLIGTQLVSNVSVDLALSEQLLANLSRAGLKGVMLLGAYNSVIASLVGFTTQEYAPVPRENSAEWQTAVRDRLAAINRDDYPVLASNLGLLSNRAFILRWQNGVEAPLDESFKIFVDIVISGIEKLILSVQSEVRPGLNQS